EAEILLEMEEHQRIQIRVDGRDPGEAGVDLVGAQVDLCEQLSRRRRHQLERRETGLSERSLDTAHDAHAVAERRAHPITRSRPDQYGSRSSRLTTLPRAFRGNSARNSMLRGRLAPPTLPRQNSISSS